MTKAKTLFDELKNDEQGHRHQVGALPGVVRHGRRPRLPPRRGGGRGRSAVWAAARGAEVSDVRPGCGDAA